MDTPIRILSVEDDDFMKMYLRDIFWLHGTQYNFKLKIVDNLEAAEAQVISPETRPHLILLDIGLPRRSGGEVDREAGFKFLERIKKDSETKDIKVIVFSAHADKEMYEQSVKLGADKFLVKGDQIPTEVIGAAREIFEKAGKA